MPFSMECIERPMGRPLGLVISHGEAHRKAPRKTHGIQYRISWELDTLHYIGTSHEIPWEFPREVTSRTGIPMGSLPWDFPYDVPWKTSHGVQWTSHGAPHGTYAHPWEVPRDAL